MALQGINSQDPEIAVGRIYRIGENLHPSPLRPRSRPSSIGAPTSVTSECFVRCIVPIDICRGKPASTFVNRRRASSLQSGEHRAPNQIAITFAAMGQLEEESRQLDRQWTLRRERARYEAERARRQL